MTLYWLVFIPLMVAVIVVAGLLAGPLVAACVAVTVVCLLIEGWLDYRPATALRASK